MAKIAFKKASAPASMNYYFYNPFDASGHGPHHRRFHHHHPYGPDAFIFKSHHNRGPWSRQPFGRREWGPFSEGRRGFPPRVFEAFAGFDNGFGPHRGCGGFSGRGRGDFGPRGCFFGRGWPFQHPEENSDSSGSEEKCDKPAKNPEEIIISGNSDSDVECLDQQQQHGPKSRCRRAGRGYGRGGCLGPCRHHRGRPCPWNFEADEGDNGMTIPVEDAPESDFQIVPDNVAEESSNLQLQPDEQKNQSNKKCFKIALNADGFKVKDIRIRRHLNILLIEGKQTSTTSLGTFERSFAYKITLPNGVDPKKIKTKLGVDGILRIKAKKTHKENENVQIEEDEEIMIQD